MKYRVFSAGLAGFGFLVASFVSVNAFAQEPPLPQNQDSVAKPKKKPADETPADGEKPIPSEFKKPKDIPKDTPTFRSNATTVNVDVSVLDDKGHFIPKIGQGNFRVLEDGVPQQISQFGIFGSEAEGHLLPDEQLLVLCGEV